MKIMLQYFKRILYVLFVMQFYFFLIIATMQSYRILNTIKGMNCDVFDFFLLIILGILEWSNFIFFVSLLIANIYVIFDEFQLNNIQIMYYQMGIHINKLFYSLLFCNTFFGSFLLINSLFLSPYTNILLQQKLLEALKNKATSMINPNNFLKINISDSVGNLYLVTSSKSEDDLYGFLLNNDKFNLTLLTHKFSFKKDNEMIAEFNNSLGYLGKFNSYVQFDNCVLKVKSDVVTIKKKESLFKNFSKAQFFNLLKIFVNVILLSFFVIILFFRKCFYQKLIVSFIYLIQSLNILKLIPLHPILYVLFSIYIFYQFSKVKYL